MLMRLLILFTLVLIGACSSGGLDDLHDPYLAIFGIPKTGPAPQKAALLGRVVRVDGSSAAWAQVYARRVDEGAPSAQPVESLTNGKGGFLLPALDPGTWRLIATTPAGEGLVAEISLKEGELREESALNLTSLRRVTGKVELENEDVATGVLVYVPGTPFSSFSDADGFFALNLPEGAFKIRAEKDMFLPAEFDQLGLTGDQALALRLAANPWPDGHVTVKGAEAGGRLVRSLSPTLVIGAVPGVKYMRMISTPTLADAKDYDALRKWQPVKKELTIALAREGYASATFEFIDDHGKESDPVDVNFIATALDPSWIVLFGYWKEPVTIKAGQKVAFFSDELPVSLQGSTSSATATSATYETYLADTDSSAVPGEKSSPKARESSPTDHPLRSGQARFAAAVTIEAGAEVRGGASFDGPLIVQGTKENPVFWGGDCVHFGCNVNLGGADVVLRYVHGTGLDIEARASLGSQKMTIEDSYFENVGVDQLADAKMAGDRASAELSVAHTTMIGGEVQQTCQRLGSRFPDILTATPSPSPVAIPAPSTDPLPSSTMTYPPPDLSVEGQVDAPVAAEDREPIPTAKIDGESSALKSVWEYAPLVAASFALTASDLDGTSVRLGCERSTWARVEAARVSLGGNIFRSAPKFGATFSGTWSKGVRGLPAVDGVDYILSPSWFADPARAVDGVTPETWPAAQLGELAAEAPSGAGVR